MTTDGDAYSLVFPFITVTSVGGPHDDDAYAAGFECGRIDAWLATAKGLGWGIEATVTARAVNAPQIDLIAMHHGFTAEAAPSEDAPEWVTIRLRQVT
jgi:hypothetical protein